MASSCSGQPTGEFLPHVFDDNFTRQLSGFSKQSSCAPHDPLLKQGNIDELELGVNGGTEWWQSLLVILASVIGVGVLSLPQAFATIGWIPGMIALLSSAYASWWSGRMYGRLVIAVPNAQVLADVVGAAYGRWGRVATMWLGYTYIGGSGVVYHLTATGALQEIFVGVPYIECQPTAGIIFGLLMLIPLQAQSMHAVSLLSLVGAGTIIVALIIVGVKLVLAGVREDAHTALTASFSPLTWSAALTSCAFAFAGQAIFVELISKQRVFSSFRFAVNLSVVVAIFTYILCASMGYAYIGSSVHGPITSVLATGFWSRFLNVCLFVHVAIGYVIELNVLTDAMLRLVWPQAWPSTAQDSLNENNVELARKGPWLIMSTVLVLSAYLLESSIPFFSELVSLVGAVGGVQIMLTLPALCALRLLPRKGFSPTQRLQCYMFIPIALIFTTMGATGALINIVKAVGDTTLPDPWSCAAPKQ